MATNTPNIGLHVIPDFDSVTRVADWANNLSGDEITSNMMIIDSEISNVKTQKVNKSILVNDVLSSVFWDGSSSPYSYTYSNADITTTCPIEILCGASITGDQIISLQNANIQGGTQNAGGVTLLAYGDKPMIDLPVRFIIRGDL